MSLDRRYTVLRLLSYYRLLTFVVMPSNSLAFNVVYNNQPSSLLSPFQSSAFYQGGGSGRKFGGYRIVPRACKDDASDGGGGGGDGTATGVCMFNYECTQLGGSVVGSCVDVFLFGACCRLPPGVKLPHTIEQPTGSVGGGGGSSGGGGGGGGGSSFRPSSSSSSPPPPPPPLSFQQPVADTVLLHRNGTAVHNAYGPDDMSADLMLANRRPLPPSSVNGNRITSKVDYADVYSSASPPFVKYSSSSTPVSKSTDSVPNIRKTTPPGFVQRPAATTSKQGYDDYYDGMVLVPTLTVNDPNSTKTPIENNSIHHILSILNQTPPTTTGTGDVDGYDTIDSDPMDTSPSYQHASSTSPPGLYTWGSVETADTKTPGYGGSSFTRPATHQNYNHHHYQNNQPSYQTQQHFDRPANGYYGSSTATPAVTSTTTTTTTATSTHHLPGPHFHVLSATNKPTDRPIAPTVIVLSSATADKHPNNKYSTTTAAVYTSSYRPVQPSSHVKPSQGIVVTGKPSVSAAYTTTATNHNHHHHQQQQQQHQQQQLQQPNLAFVPVSSTTLADHYYNTNNDYNSNYAVHTSSSKPPAVVNYGHRPATSSTTSTTTPLPPTLSSTLYHDDGGGGGGGNGGNNNVFTTVITSVNHHQYHNKYRPTPATNTVARPVLNTDSMAVISSSTAAAAAAGYRPHQTLITTAGGGGVDDDYPSALVVTSPSPPPPQVYITATGDVHQHYPHRPYRPVTAADVDDELSTVVVTAAFNSTDTFAFPPVRDPNVNMTVVQQQQEKPDLEAVGGDYESDADPNPQLTADDNLDDKVHLFVEKVVQSLQGNFEDLERVLLAGDPSSSNVTVGMADEPVSPQQPNKKPAATTTTTRKPPRPGAVKPSTAKPTKAPKPVTYRPTPIAPPTDAPPHPADVSAAAASAAAAAAAASSAAGRPTKIPTLLTPVQLFQPTTYTARPPPTKQPPNRLTPITTVVLDALNVEHDHRTTTTTAEPDYRKVCGVRPLVRKNGRIVGGTGSTFGEWPWQVLVREATWLGLFTKNKCGGVLITQKHVITAAHCQPGFLANLVAVFGEYDISGEVESKRSVSKNVKRVIVHRQYDAATFENDIALLELESPVTYDQHIVPICMPDDDDDFTGRMASVTGWGRLKYGGGVPSILQEVQVPIIENQVCQDMFETAGHSKTILSSFLCAGYANGQRDSCEGDSGGPLMIEKDNGRWTLIGTVSHGIKCAAPYLPGVYMRTTYYKPWLQTITGVQ